MLEHEDQARGVAGSVGSVGAREEAIDLLVASARARADALSSQIREALSASGYRVFADLDLVCAVPDQVAQLPRMAWLLGALSALAAVRAAHALARVQTNTSRVQLPRAFMRLVKVHAVAMQLAWQERCADMIRRNPWIEAEATQIELVDLESDRPFFRVSSKR